MHLKRVFVTGTAGFVITCLGLYYIFTNSRGSGSGKKLIPKPTKKWSLPKFSPANSLRKNASSSFASGLCSASFGIDESAKSNINMLDIYEQLTFDNPDGGAWKQGWDVQVNHSRFTDSNKLRVFVVPHSHNDPGWLKTFEQYFEDQTKHILDYMLENLSKDKTVKFIWAEISYFSLWWNDLSDSDKNRVKRIIETGQLEFVTGGWCMPDESSSHYYSVLTQLIEGHQWLFHHLGYIPKNGWSIDPFGMSPTMAYFLQRAGLSNMLIQRTHYSVKKHLAEIRELEFKWRQSWDSQGKTDIICHMMPFYFYDIPHTCGPDPRVCCQFDFKRMTGVSSLTCPWGSPPEPISSSNVKSRSVALLEQYQKKAMLYKTNVLLIPLGDDFRWEDQLEWTAQVTNYQKIFDYINSQPELHAEIKFATLGDYFEALALEVNEQRFSPSVLTGDFFTYADRDDHYWSGYFTSRPFHKAMDRELIGHLRSAQILFTLMCAEISRKYSNGLESPFVKDLLGNLIVARRHLSLFQHHDGIAGTARDHVMVDYANKLYDGLQKSNNVMQQSLHVLSHLQDPDFELSQITKESQFYNSVHLMGSSNKLFHYNLIVIDENYPYQILTVFNPILQKRVQLVNVYVSTYQVSVWDMNDVLVDFEILPVFEDKIKISKSVCQLSIVVEMEPLAVKNLKIQYSEAVEFENVPGPEIYVKNSDGPNESTEMFVVEHIEENSPVKISNGYLTVHFGANGFAESVQVNQNTYPFSIGMFKCVKLITERYGAKTRKEMSGLYLFIPDGEATPIDADSPFIRVVKGRLQSYVEVWLKQVVHRITLFSHPGLEKYAVDVTNVVDVRQERNFELMMRFHTDINSGDISYTDLNGFQMIRRKRFPKLPLQANYYPFPTATFIEDPDLRMTVLSKQPLGTASLSSGEIEVMLDRRLNQDDNRGVGQGCLDNLETVNKFKVLFETPDCVDTSFETKPPMLSLSAQMTSHSLLHPLKAFVNSPETYPTTFAGLEDYTVVPNPQNLACDIQLVDMPMLPSFENSLDDNSFVPVSHAGLLVHRVGFDGQFMSSTPISGCSTEETKLGHFDMRDLTGHLFQPELQQMTLSFVHEGQSVYSNESTLLEPMEVYGFQIAFQSSNDDSSE